MNSHPLHRIKIAKIPPYSQLKFHSAKYSIYFNHANIFPYSPLNRPTTKFSPNRNVAHNSTHNQISKSKMFSSKPISSIIAALETQSKEINSLINTMTEIHELCNDSEVCIEITLLWYSMGMKYFNEDAEKIKNRVEKVTEESLREAKKMDEGDEQIVKEKVEELRGWYRLFETTIEQTIEWVRESESAGR